MKHIFSSLQGFQKIPRVRLVFFALFAIATLAAPLGMIAHYENIRSNGVVHKFRVAPVDPSDLLRGRYVQLQFANTDLPVNKKFFERHWNRGGAAAYVLLKKGADGFSVPVKLSHEMVEGGGTDVIMVNKLSPNYWRNEGKEELEARFNYPFDRFYLPENVAPKAEYLYRSSFWNVADDKRGVTYVTVRVLGGKAVLEELYINGVPVREAVRNANKAK